MKLIFLDFDGVCTSTLETPGSYLNHTLEEYGPSASCISRLIKLCDDTGAKVIISSNWRKFEDDGKWSFNGTAVQNPLPALKKLLGDNCIGSLPPNRHMNKSAVLLSWLDVHIHKVASFAIFDDDLSEGFQNIADYGIRDKFVHVDYVTGLTDNDCKKAYNILREERLHDS